MISIMLNNHSIELTADEALKLSETLIACSKEPGAKKSLTGKYSFCTVSNNELSAKDNLKFSSDFGIKTNC